MTQPIAPTGTWSNYISGVDILERWENENRWLPIQKVQIWTQNTGVEEFFALVPDVYKRYYPDGVLNPDKWDDQKHTEVAMKWKQKIVPTIPLPIAWKKYLLEHQNLLTFSEQDNQIINDYNDLYNRRIKIECLDVSHNPLGVTVEERILNWVYSDSSNVIFLLGDFGDGKTFLTYSLARKLSEDFIISPTKGVIPLRLTLKDFTEQIHVQDFLRIRLESFGSNLSDWNNVRRKYPVLIMLDGFDEMSTGMDSKTITKNISRLWSCVNSLKGVKLIVSSRSTIFKSYKIPLESRIKPSEILYLAPIGFEDKMNYLETFAREHNLMDNFNKLRSTHDVLGLASKPIFLGMMETIMLSGYVEKLNNLSIYDKYTKIILERKPEIEHDLDNSEESIDLLAVADKLKILMEDFAIIDLGRNGITFDDLKEELIEYRDNPMALILWNNLITPTQDDKENSETRIINRSLLKETSSGYTLFHRSMQEYFVAKWISRCLDESPDKVEDRLSKIKLNPETVNFIGQILSSLSSSEATKAKKYFVSMIEKTRNKSTDDEEILSAGTIAINVYFKAWKQLPDIDWRNLVLNDAYLPEADFSNKNLSGSSLRYANLDNANFTNAILTGCDLTGVRFEETKDVIAMRFVSDDRLYLYALYSDGKLRKWDIYNEQNNKHIEVAKDLELASHIYSSRFGIIIYNNKNMFFIHNTEKDMKIQAIINYDKSISVLDVKYDKILFNKNNILSLFDLNSREYIFQNVNITTQSKAIITSESKYK